MADNETTTTSVSISGQDSTAPLISNVQSSGITTNSAIISWETDENSTSYVDYGTTVGLGLSAGDNNLVGSHTVSLTNLNDNTIYYFQVRSADALNNSRTDNNGGNYYSLTTQVLGGGTVFVPPPSQPTYEKEEEILIEIDDSDIYLENNAPFTKKPIIEIEFKDFEDILWMKLSEEKDLDKLDWEPFKKELAEKLSDGDGKKTIYFQFKNKENQESDVIEKNIILDTEGPPASVNFRAQLIDNHVEFGWELPSRGDAKGIRIFKSEEDFIMDPLANKEIVFEGESEKAFDFEIEKGKKYFYSAFCYDYARNYSSAALAIIETTPTEEKEEIVIEKSIKSYVLDLAKKSLKVIIGDTVYGIKEKLAEFHYLEKTPLTIILSQEQFLKNPKNIFLKLENSLVYGFKGDGDKWELKLETPPIKGKFELTIEINYFDESKEAAKLGTILIDPYGYVYQTIVEPHLKLFEGGLWSWDNKVEENRLAKAKVFLYQFDESKEDWHLFEAHNYNQINPQITDEYGEYGWLTPRGKFYIEAIKLGFGEKRIEEFEVIDDIVNKNIELSFTVIPWWKVGGNVDIILTIILIITIILSLIIIIRMRRKLQKENGYMYH